MPVTRKHAATISLNHYVITECIKISFKRCYGGIINTFDIQSIIEKLDEGHPF